MRPCWLRPQKASWTMKILGLPAMSAPLLAVTAIQLAVCHFPGLKPVDCCLLAVFELL